MFKGLRTVVYEVNDIQQAKAWYSMVLQIEPYFDEPFYVGFNVGGYELGLQPGEKAVGSSKSDGVKAYWGVEDIDAALKRLLDEGATLYEGVQDIGGGIQVATVRDPFGNLFGIIVNPEFELPDEE